MKLFFSFSGSKKIKFWIAVLLINLGNHEKVLAKTIKLETGLLSSDPKLATHQIQSKIDSLSTLGGGFLHFPVQKITIGTLVLKSGVKLFLPQGCVLQGDTLPELFPDMAPKQIWFKGKENHHNRAIIYAEGQTNIGISGKGTLDGQGEKVYSRFLEGKIPFRWMNILFTQCQNVSVSGIKLINSPSWMQFYQGCKNLKISDIRVSNFGAKNNDGLDLESCQHVKIENAVIHSDDDALVFKSMSEGEMKNVSVRHCLLSSNCNALKTGTESECRISNLRFAYIQIIRPIRPSPIYKRQTGLAGIALTMVDGGTLEKVSFRNISISGYKVPLFLRQGKRNRTHLEAEVAGKSAVIENVAFRKLNLQLISDIPNHFTAVDSGSVRDLSFSKIQISLQIEDSLTLGPSRLPFEDKPKAYPEATMFGKHLPEQIFFFKNVKAYAGLMRRNRSFSYQKEK